VPVAGVTIEIDSGLDTPRKATDVCLWVDYTCMFCARLTDQPCSNQMAFSHRPRHCAVCIHNISGNQSETSHTALCCIDPLGPAASWLEAGNITNGRPTHCAGVPVHTTALGCAQTLRWLWHGFQFRSFRTRAMWQAASRFRQRLMSCSLYLGRVQATGGN
jgi:hypothetical protein